MTSTAREGLEWILESCKACEACMVDCELFQELGLSPYVIAERILSGSVDQNVVDFVLRCDLCGRCTELCSEAIDIPAMVAHARQALHRMGLIDREIYRPMWIDYDWNTFSIFRDTYQIDYGDIASRQCETLFFPGCVLSTYAPSLTNAAVNWLVEYGYQVGLSLMCCGIPLMQIGAIDRAEHYSELFWEKVRKRGALRVVTACPMCHRYLSTSDGKQAIEVVSLYQLMVDAGVRAKSLNGRIITVHDSCPARQGNLGEYVRSILSNFRIVEMSKHGKSTICCGSGGMVSAIDRELCIQRADARVIDFNKCGADTCVTYCMSCARSLHRTGRLPSVRHVLELVFDIPLDYEEIQYCSEAMWEDEWGEYNLQRLENSLPGS